MKYLSLTFLLSLMLIAPGFAQSVDFSAKAMMSNIPAIFSEQCTLMYSGALNKIVSDKRYSIFIQTIQQNACSESNFSLSGKFDSKTQSLIDSVPLVSSVLGSLNISDNKKFCEAYKSGTLSVSNTDTYSSEPVVAAMRSANACLDIASKSGTVITHFSPNPGQVVFTGTVPNDGRVFKFSGQTSGDFSCIAPKTSPEEEDEILGNKVIKRERNFNIMCGRNGVKTNGNIDFIRGDITIVGLDGQIYPATILADEMYGVSSRRESNDTIASHSQTYELQLSNAAKNASNLNYELNRYKNSRVIRWYYYQTLVDSANSGERFDCGAWNSPNKFQIANNGLCPNGDVINRTQINGNVGGNCGFNSFAAICVPRP